MSRADSKLPEVATPHVGGVRVTRHVLDLEAGSLAWLARRVGRRLNRWLKQCPEEIRGHLIEWKQGVPVSVPMLNASGDPIMVPALPDGEFRENWRWYQTTILGLLKEQRERAKLTPKNGAPILTDEEYQAELRVLVAESVRSMPEDELRELLAARTAKAPIEAKP